LKQNCLSIIKRKWKEGKKKKKLKVNDIFHAKDDHRPTT
jgi:hypothetical protein